jgi:hypothetical protein
MAHYKVIWIIDVEADEPEQAAQKALGIQKSTDCLDGYFHTVTNVDSGDSYSVDISEDHITVSVKGVE